MRLCAGQKFAKKFENIKKSKEPILNSGMSNHVILGSDALELATGFEGSRFLQHHGRVTCKKPTCKGIKAELERGNGLKSYGVTAH